MIIIIKKCEKKMIVSNYLDNKVLSLRLKQDKFVEFSSVFLIQSCLNYLKSVVSFILKMLTHYFSLMLSIIFALFLNLVNVEARITDYEDV